MTKRPISKSRTAVRAIVFVLIAVLGLDAAGIDALQADGVVQAANPTGTGATR